MSVIVALHSDRTVLLPLVHALKLAYATCGEIEVIDVRPQRDRNEPAKVRRILEQWKILPEGSERNAVAGIGLKVKKISKEGNQKKILQRRLQAHDHQLLVIGINKGIVQGKLLRYSLPEYCAHYFNRETLFFPSDGRSFVDAESGEIALRRVVIPVENEHFFTPAAFKLIDLMKRIPIMEKVDVTIVHAGQSMPVLDPIVHERIRVKEIVRESGVVDAICSVVDSASADLVIMATNGRDTMAQKIIGSNTEQVLRKISCPVWTINIPR